MGNETFRKFKVTNKGILVGTDRKMDGRINGMDGRTYGRTDYAKTISFWLRREILVDSYTLT